MKKVLIIGSPGAGKSTFARKLSKLIHLPVYYLDMIWHKPDKTNITREEFDQKLEEILKKDYWMIDGNYLRTMERRLKACDTVFFLDYTTEICLSGAKERIGKKREDMPWVETEFDEEFRQWILDFAKDQRPEIYRLLEENRSGREIYVFHEREEANRFLEQLSKRIEKE